MSFSETAHSSAHLALSLDTAVVEHLPTGPRDWKSWVGPTRVRVEVGVGRGQDQRLCGLLRRVVEQRHGRLHHEIQRGIRTGEQAGGRNAGVHVVRPLLRTGGLEPALQLAREHHVRELALPVRLGAQVLAVLVVRVVHAPAVVLPVRDRRDRDDAVRQPVQQQAGQREVPEMVDAELHLEALLGAAQRDVHQAGVVDEHVDLAGAIREGVHRIQVGQVQGLDGHVAVDPVGDALGARDVAARHHDAPPVAARWRVTTSPRPPFAPVTT